MIPVWQLFYKPKMKINQKTISKFHLKLVPSTLNGSSFFHWVKAETTSGYLIEKLMEEREENCSSFDDGLAWYAYTHSRALLRGNGWLISPLNYGAVQKITERDSAKNRQWTALPSGVYLKMARTQQTRHNWLWECCQTIGHLAIISKIDWKLRFFSCLLLFRGSSSPVRWPSVIFVKLDFFCFRIFRLLFFSFSSISSFFI